MEKIMSRLTGLKPLWVMGLFVLLDLFCVGMGMGVPLFCILLGLPVGWFIVEYITARTTEMREVLLKVLRYAAITATFTLLVMCLLWGPTSAFLFDPGNDLSQTGVPLILYEPRASFIGWLVLMMVISPILQLLTTLFGAYLDLLHWLGGNHSISSG